MTDEEYVFRQTSRERKRNGIGTFNKKRQGGKYVRLPSDNLSRAEKRKMNGGVRVYNFGTPMSWNEFKAAPDDIKKEYISTLLEKFNGVPGSVIAESFGIDKKIMGAYLSKHGICFGRGPGNRSSAKRFFESEDGIAWKKWVSGESVRPKQIKEEPAVKEIVEGKPAEEGNSDKNEPVKVQGDISKVAELLVGLVGTGAKVTIEFVL